MKGWAYGVIGVFMLGCGASARELPPPVKGKAPTFRSVKASAPTGTHSGQLGIPFDREFNPIPTSTLFPDAAPPRRIEASEIRHEMVTVETEEQLAANAKAWGVALSTSVSKSRRFAAYRAYELAYVEELDDSTSMSEPPIEAVYYPWRIYYGRSYEAVVSGAERDFNASARASFLIFSGGVDGFTAERSLQFQAAGKGLRPKTGKAIFAKSESEIRTEYEGVGPVVPVFIEYRQIPSRTAKDGAIAWIPTRTVEVRFEELTVVEDGTWGSTPWTLAAECHLAGAPPAGSQSSLLPADLRVDNGTVHALTWSYQTQLFDGDVLECGTAGSIHDHVTTLQPLPSGGMRLEVTPDLKRTGAFEAKAAKASYTVAWSARVVP